MAGREEVECVAGRIECVLLNQVSSRLCGLGMGVVGNGEVGGMGCGGRWGGRRERRLVVGCCGNGMGVGEGRRLGGGLWWAMGMGVGEEAARGGGGLGWATGWGWGTGGLVGVECGVR